MSSTEQSFSSVLALMNKYITGGEFVMQFNLVRMHSGRVRIFMRINMVEAGQACREDWKKAMNDAQCPALRMFFWMCMQHVLQHLGAAQCGSLLSAPEAGKEFLINERSPPSRNYVTFRQMGDEREYLPAEEVLRTLSTREGWSSIESAFFNSNFSSGKYMSMRDLLSFKDEMIARIIHDKVLAFAMGSHRRLGSDAKIFSLSNDVVQMIAMLALEGAPEYEDFAWIRWTQNIR